MLLNMNNNILVRNYVEHNLPKARAQGGDLNRRLPKTLFIISRIMVVVED